MTNTPILSVDFVISLPIFADFVTEWHTVFSSKAGQNGRNGALCDNLPTSLWQKYLHWQQLTKTQKESTLFIDSQLFVKEQFIE